MASKVLLTDNFVNLIPDEEPKDTDQLDRRTLIYARNALIPNSDQLTGEFLQTYLNYLAWVQQLIVLPGISPQPAYMLNLGYLPRVMMPTFWPVYAGNFIKEQAAAKGLHVHASTELAIFTSRTSSVRQRRNQRFDYWVNRQEVCAKFGGDIKTITTREVLKRVLA